MRQTSNWQLKLSNSREEASTNGDHKQNNANSGWPKESIKTHTEQVGSKKGAGRSNGRPSLDLPCMGALPVSPAQSAATASLVLPVVPEASLGTRMEELVGFNAEQ